MIKDSGNRTEFETGAVRDIQEGKGRCDLMPLDVVSDLYARFCDDVPEIGVILGFIADFQLHGNPEDLEYALDYFVTDSWSEMFLEVAKHFEEGAKKYGENNWKKGIPVCRYIDSAVRHYLKWIHCDTDERHDRAFCWNILCAIWTCKHLPHLNDYAVKDGESND